MARESLKVTWTDHRGKVWDLTRGTQGVILDLDQEGLNWSSLSHNWERGDQFWTSGSVDRGTHDLKVLVGWRDGAWLTGSAYYQLADEWWSQANSPFALGTLTITRPDGVTRSRRLRLADTPGTSMTYDPGIGQEKAPELWQLTGNGGYWEGGEQSFSYSGSDMSSATPYYGPTGAGWPLYISAGHVATDAFMVNQGQGPMWLTWILSGPMTNPRFGVQGSGVLTYTGNLLDGQVLEVSTDPTNRYAIDTYSRVSSYGALSGQWAPVPVGDRVPLHVSADAMGAGASITAIGRELYARAF